MDIKVEDREAIQARLRELAERKGFVIAWEPGECEALRRFLDREQEE